jgi:hypothetical protein
VHEFAQHAHRLELGAATVEHQCILLQSDAVYTVGPKCAHLHIRR